MFASVSVLLFGSLPTYSTLDTALIYWFQAAIGSFDLGTMELMDKDGNRMEFLYDFGVIYTLIFLMANLILLFNFVIAILSDTFSIYNPLKQGLYFNTLNKLSRDMTWNQEFGALVCSKPPIITHAILVPYFHSI
jgi:hypothetical protein